MVRLKVLTLLNVELSIRFQFHYGSIKSLENVQYDNGNKVFQFHYGSIKSGHAQVHGTAKV